MTAWPLAPSRSTAPEEARLADEAAGAAVRLRCRSIACWSTRRSRTSTPTAATGCSSPGPAASGSTGPPLAASDAELVELIRRVAAQGGRTERRFDDAKPLLNLRLPDGSRLSAVMHVAGRPSLSIRRHRHTDVSLADLVGPGHARRRPGRGAWRPRCAARTRSTSSWPAVPTPGKTTFLRALLAEIEPWERLVVIEDALELQLERDPRAPSRTWWSWRPGRPTSRARARSPCATWPATRCAWRRTA